MDGVADKVHVTKRVQKPRGKAKNATQAAMDHVVRAMILQGSSVRATAQALCISPNTVQRVRNELKELVPEGENLKSGLITPFRDERMGALIDHFVSKGLTLKKVKGSDALGAMKVYADRRWPTHQDNAPPVINFINVDLGQFRPDPLDEAQDVTPTPTGSGAADGKAPQDENLNEFNTGNVL